MVKVIECESYEKLSERAADIISEQILVKPNSVLGLATGSTPVGAYQKLVEKYKEGSVDFNGITAFNLDEYCGIDKEHSQSYYTFMRENLFSHVNIDLNNTHIPDGRASDIDKQCSEYDAMIDAAGGIDLQLLGIGGNGHIGFNEPCDCFPVGTHIISLHPSTIEANSRFFDSVDDVPTQALTMGLGSIMKAKKILLLAFGESKRETVKKAFSGPVVPSVPASVLQLHPDVTVLWG